MSQQKPPKEDKNGLKNAAKLSGIGLQMGLTIYLGSLLGGWLDGKLDTVFLKITCTLLAVVISLYSVIKQANQLNK